MNAIAKEYKEKTGGDLIPLYMVMGNSIFAEKFGQSTIALYSYCIEHNKTWEEVLEWEEIPGVEYLTNKTKKRKQKSRGFRGIFIVFC